MDNVNTNDYLEKIKIQVIENLKRTAHAPSVQMQEVPRNPMMGMTEEEEDELNDLDDDENKDTRSTQRKWDARITRDDELDESEDEDERKANGIHRQNGQIRRKNITDFPNPHSTAADEDMNSGAPTPTATNVVDDARVTEANAAVHAEVMASKMENKQLNAVAAILADEAGPSNAASRAESPAPVVDQDGDVDMDTPAEAVEPVVAPASPRAPSPIASPPASLLRASAQATPPAEQVAPPAADVALVPAPEPVSTVIEPVPQNGVTDAMDIAMGEGEAEREAEDITAEATTAIAEQSEQ